MQPEQRLRVLVVDGDPLARRLIRDALRPAGILIVGEVPDERDAVRAARYYKPDVILLDVVGSSVDELAVLEQILADGNVTAEIVILSARTELDLGHIALRMGAVGYLNKDLDPRVLPRVLRDVAEGGAAVSRSFTAELVRRLRDVPEGGIGLRPVHSVLTTREWEIVDQLSVGCSTEQIADAFVLSQETVRTHIKNIQRKLDAHTRDEVVDVVRRLRMGVLLPRTATGHANGSSRLAVAHDRRPDHEDHGPVRARPPKRGPARLGGGTLAVISEARARRAASVSEAGYRVATNAVTPTGAVQSVQISHWRVGDPPGPRRSDRTPQGRPERASGVGS
jgi:DNA-binding NarL/FixJ family response regulator